MKAVIYNKKSTSNKLIYTEVDKPIPKDNEVLIEVIATSINAADYRMMGFGVSPKNQIFGADISGVIKEVGKGITKFKPGDSVIGDLSDFGFGGLAEYAVAPQDALTLKPDSVPYEVATGLPLAGVTALQAFKKCGYIKEGGEALIVGSSGGVGTFAVQLAKYYGLKVTGVCSKRNIEQTRKLGADTIIDYREEDFTKMDKSYDIILAINGGYPLSAYRRLLKPNGKYVMVGGTLSQILKTILFGWLFSLGRKKMIFYTAKSDINDLELLLNLAEEGKISTVVDRTFNLKDTPDAVKYIKERHSKGKIIIKVK